MKSTTKESLIKGFLQAMRYTVIILGLITIFLFQRGYWAFGQYRHELDHYRRSGMEYANVVTVQHDDLHFYRYLENTLSKETEHLESLEQGSQEAKVEEKKMISQTLRTFQDTKEALLLTKRKWSNGCGNKIVSAYTEWSFGIGAEAIRSNLPAEDFNLRLNKSGEGIFSHAESQGGKTISRNERKISPRELIRKSEMKWDLQERRN